MSKSIVISARGLTIRRGSRDVLRQLEFELSAGGITALVGPSGCGKTTLMRSVVGLQKITGGSLTVLGAPAGTASLRSRIGYAPQGTSAYLDLTVLENVRYFAACVGADRDDIDRVVADVDLASSAHQLTGSLSGGQRSRVSLAIALLGSPDLLVLDEPTVGLDPLLREQLWQLFADLASTGVTLIVSSHVMDEAERCQDVLLMRDGRVLAQQNPAVLKERTATTNLDEAFLRLVRDDEAEVAA
ncbi:MAG: ABC transporter ATP-binding protein [Nocardioidaceae bacterium]